MLIKVSSFALLFTLVACVHAPNKETARYTSKYSYEQTVEMVRVLVRKCWTRQARVFGSDAIYGRSSRGNGNYVVTLGRDNRDISFMPFARIIVHKIMGNVVVSVEEGDVFLKSKWGVDKSVEEWLKGNHECVNNK